MTFSMQENLTLCDWLMEKGLTLEQCSVFLREMELGNTFALALTTVFENRKKIMDELYEKNDAYIWHDPITP